MLGSPLPTFTNNNNNYYYYYIIKDYIINNNNTFVEHRSALASEAHSM